MSVARAMFPKAKEPRYTFEVLVRLLPEATLKFTQDGISLKAIDPTKTALIYLQFYAASFEDYVLEEETKVGLIFTTIKDVLKRIGTTEKLEVEVDKERNRFIFNVYPKKGKEVGLVRRFSFPIVEVVEEEVPELALEFSAQAEVKPDVFSDVLELIKAAGSDWVQISISPEGVAFRGVGDGGKAAEVTLNQGDEGLLNIVASQTVSAKYSVETIELFIDKFKSVTKSMRISISENKPMKMEFYFGTGELTAIVAPRVDYAAPLAQ